jgi:predicted DNA-binding transcriptional regulator AlpA
MKRLLLDRFAGTIASEAATKGSPDELLSDRELAAELRLSQQTLQLWRMRGIGPAFVKLSPKCVRYRRSAVVAWLESRAANSTADHPHVAGPGRPAKKREGKVS